MITWGMRTRVCPPGRCHKAGRPPTTRRMWRLGPGPGPRGEACQLSVGCTRDHCWDFRGTCNFWEILENFPIFKVADPHYFNERPDPSFHVKRLRIRLFTLMRIRFRILLLIKVMWICDHLSKGSSRLHFERPCLHCERPGPSRLHFDTLLLLNFESYADPDPIQVPKTMRIRIRNPPYFRISTQEIALKSLSTQQNNVKVDQ